MESVKIGKKTCHILQKGKAPGPCIYWSAAAGDRSQWEVMPGLLGDRFSYLLVVCEAEDWNRELSPWTAAPVFGGNGFSGGGPHTLGWLMDSCIPYVEKNFSSGQPRLLGGYSLAGLFSLWAFYESSAFQGAASCSGSLWYPQWTDFVQTKTAPENSFIYLSLGEREELTRNPAMARVGDVTREQYRTACSDPHVAGCTLEWNPGGHFKDPAQRLAKGFTWLLEQFESERTGQ